VGFTYKGIGIIIIFSHGLGGLWPGFALAKIHQCMLLWLHHYLELPWPLAVITVGIVATVKIVL
jgi:hypothetical protein